MKKRNFMIKLRLVAQQQSQTQQLQYAYILSNIACITAWKLNVLHKREI